MEDRQNSWITSFLRSCYLLPLSHCLPSGPTSLGAFFWGIWHMDCQVLKRPSEIPKSSPSSHDG